MGITGKVGGATAEHLLARGNEVRALVRNREKASSWANRGVELVDGDWNDSAATERALKGVEGAFAIVLFRHLPELSSDVDIFLFGRRAVVLIVSLFALFCFSLELERLGVALGNDRPK
jgi:uncharacterized protein YbjT (DUF2867 family)